MFKGTMKRQQGYLIALITCLAVGALRSESANSFRFVNAEVNRVLEAYASVAGAQLVIASEVTNVAAKITIEAGSPTADEAKTILAEALLSQVGIVITPMEDGRVSVTFNDTLHREANKRAVKASPLSPSAAAVYAARLANDECERLHKKRPFKPEQYAAMLEGGNYRWGRIDPAGPGGLSAIVTFRPDGTHREVHVYFSTDKVD